MLTRGKSTNHPGWRRGMFRIASVILLGVLAAGVAHAIPIAFERKITNADWTSGGCGGVGSVGECTLQISNVNGPVLQAFLVWHGIGNPTYTNPDVTLNGSPVTGTSVGPSSTNCWGSGSSDSYIADVSLLVPGNGAYTVAGIAQGALNNSGNGASLVVIYNDGAGFRSPRTHAIPRGDRILTHASAAGDVDRDGRLDLVEGNWSYGATKSFIPEFSHNRVVYNRGDSFEPERRQVVISYMKPLWIM